MLFDDGCTAELISPGRIADYQPPLRLRSDPAPVVRRARLSDRRLLGTVARRGTSQRKPQRQVPQTHGGHHRASGRRREPRGNPRKSPRERPLQSLDRADVLRQPTVPVRLRAVRRCPPGGTPPSSIGKFGGDTDNWAWPRHTGDFSMFRIYADKDNRPAAYSPDNVPYRSKKHFKISTEVFRKATSR